MSVPRLAFGNNHSKDFDNLDALHLLYSNHVLKLSALEKLKSVHNFYHRRFALKIGAIAIASLTTSPLHFRINGNIDDMVNFCIPFTGTGMIKLNNKELPYIGSKTLIAFGNENLEMSLGFTSSVNIYMSRKSLHKIISANSGITEHRFCELDFSLPKIIDASKINPMYFFF